MTTVHVSADGPVTVVAIDRLDRRNAVDPPTAAALLDAFVAFDEDTSASVAVLTGRGATFCAGADLKAAAEGRLLRVAEDGPGPMGPTRLELSKPVIAAVEGFAVAGGLELAIWCDLRVAAADATFGVFCRRFGVPLIDGGTVRLPRLIGQGRALDLILSGREVGADEALSMGLVNRVVPSGAALAEAVEWAHRLAALPQTCMRNDRSSTLGQWGQSVVEAMRTELRVGLDSLASPDAAAGSQGFASGAGRHGSGLGAGRPLTRQFTVDVAAFDFDGTLTNGGSVFGFLSALAGWRSVTAASAVLAPGLAAAALAGGTRADRAKEELFQRVLAGTPVERLEEVAVRFGRDHVARHLRAEVHERLDWHRGRGDRVVVVSASPAVYVREAAAMLGADGVIATGLEVDADGTLSGRYQGANCRGAEKLRRLRQWMADSGTEPGRLWAYGNSRGDLVMLRPADVGVNVGRLGSMGALRGYPRLDRTGPAIRPA